MQSCASIRSTNDNVITTSFCGPASLPRLKWRAANASCPVGAAIPEVSAAVSTGAMTEWWVRWRTGGILFSSRPPALEVVRVLLNRRRRRADTHDVEGLLILTIVAVVVASSVAATVRLRNRRRLHEA